MVSAGNDVDKARQILKGGTSSPSPVINDVEVSVDLSASKTNFIDLLSKRPAQSSKWESDDEEEEYVEFEPESLPKIKEVKTTTVTVSATEIEPPSRPAPPPPTESWTETLSRNMGSRPAGVTPVLGVSTNSTKPKENEIQPVPGWVPYSSKRVTFSEDVVAKIDAVNPGTKPPTPKAPLVNVIEDDENKEIEKFNSVFERFDQLRRDATAALLRSDAARVKNDPSPNPPPSNSGTAGPAPPSKPPVDYLIDSMPMLHQIENHLLTHAIADPELLRSGVAFKLIAAIREARCAVHWK